MPAAGVDASGRPTEHQGGAVSGQVAATGSAIGNAAALAYGFNQVTGTDGTKGVQLPAPFPGAEVTVYSGVATNAIIVYPPVNGTINDGSANSSVSVAARTLTIFRGTNSVNWGSAS